MLFISTRGQSGKVSSAHAIKNGLASDGGLYVPQRFPEIPLEEILSMHALPYEQCAVKILSLFLTDYRPDELTDCAVAAYSREKFGPDPAPLRKVCDRTDVLELWHGPTMAFKDIALQILPHLMTRAQMKTGSETRIVILAATSGDTGKAALEGFADVPGTEIIVFYPEDGVSPVQKLQMVTQTGSNTKVFGILGNFDDAQRGVKEIFGDAELGNELKECGWTFSSANSINWGRLVPQITYYFKAYADAVANERIQPGEKIIFSVPTGNFGDILAGYYAKKMGLPVKHFICASNSNNVLSDFINTGVYDKNRDFYTTVSPSMDILVSSNLERLLYAMSGNNDVETKSYMDALKTKGVYEVSDTIKEKIAALFWGGYADEDATKATIHGLFEQQHYLSDTHTAVAVAVCDDYIRETGDKTPVVIASTASPYKFSKAVLGALDRGDLPETEFDMVEQLHEITGAPVPAPLASLRGKTARFGDVTDKDAMQGVVLRALGIGE